MLSPSTPVACRLVPAGRVWLCDDDLGIARVPSYALAHDARGYLWVGSERGPIRFDGLAWETPAGLATLGACIVRGFAAAPDGALWVATDNAGLACIDLNATPYRMATHLTTADGLPGDTVGAVCVDGAGGVWAATSGGVALIRDGRVRRTFGVADGLPSERAWTLCRDHRDRVWVGTKGGLAVIDGGTVARVDTAAADGAQRSVHALCCDARGGLTVGLVGGAVCRVDETGGGWALAPLAETAARVRALCAHGDSLWVGTDAGVHRLRAADGAVEDTWTGADGLPVRGVWALARDDDGRVWASTSAGLALLARPAPLALALPADSGVPQGLVFACEPDGLGRMWVVSEQGVVAVGEADMRPAALPPLPDAVGAQLTWAVRRDSLGRMWVGTDRAGLFCLDPATGAVRAHLAAGSRVPSLCLVGGHHLWASVAGDGLLCVDVATGAVVRRVGRAEGLPHEVVYGLHADDEGQLWAGTWSGDLACLDARDGSVQATLSLAPDGDAPRVRRPVMDLAGDTGGRLWAATYGGGLVCVDRRSRAVVGAETAREGAPSDLLYACLVAADGAVWAGTARGVARYLPAERRWSVVGRGLGLPSEECNARALHLDARARLWVGTVGGVGVVDTGRVSADDAPCPVYLTGLTVMGAERAIAPGLEIEDSDYDLLVSYGAVAFAGAAQVAYRVQLEGLEADWSAPTAQRTARYTNLRPGAYTFRVAARGWGGRWSAPAAVSFRVVRDRKAQALEEALERARIDKEVALATAALFERLALEDGLTGLLNRRAIDERLGQEFARARERGRPLTVALADIDHFKGINDTYGHQVGDLVLREVGRLCRATLRADDSVGRYGGEEIALLLPETTGARAMGLCERVRRAVEGFAWGGIAPGLRVTLSIGLSDWVDAPHHEKMMADADRHLYRAKAAGRNRVCRAAAPAA